ncbi:DUF1836 domain-containing protein [Paenisporosarcina cavernae]|uniref:DUF1836 domain-containing protein n=2 Tax=Paenisporosarcina cavernae TaxID=2320858 RepID=A0A385YZG0_9BACL|nr:DUF1836 domain-containing protein [Paenisporosarcina cavernae]
MQLFEEVFEQSKRNPEEKIMTKTMINNYAKGKLLQPIENKKYSKNNILLIALIYHMKGTLSLQDIQKVLHQVKETNAIEALYETFENAQPPLTDHFEQSVQTIEEKESDRIQKILSFVQLSNFYRKAAEQLIDELPEIPEPKKSKPVK